MLGNKIVTAEKSGKNGVAVSNQSLGQMELRPPLQGSGLKNGNQFLCRVLQRSPDYDSGMFWPEDELAAGQELWNCFTKQVVRILKGDSETAFGVKEESVVNEFVKLAMECIDSLLPELLDQFSFQTAGAAIRFAQQIFLIYLKQNQELTGQTDIKEQLKVHLYSVMSGFSSDNMLETESEKQEDETDVPIVRAKRNKRYVNALARIKKQREAQREAQGGADKKKIIKDNMANWGQADHDEFVERLTHLNNKTMAEEIVTLISKKSGGSREYKTMKNEFYFLELLEHRNSFQDKTDFLHRLSESFGLLGFSAKQEREELLNLLIENKLVSLQYTDDLYDKFIENTYFLKSDAGAESFGLDFFCEEINEPESVETAETMEWKDPMQDFEDRWETRWKERREEASKKSREEQKEKNPRWDMLKQEMADKAGIVDLVVGSPNPSRNPGGRLRLYEIFDEIEKGRNGYCLLEQYEDFFAHMKLPPGDEHRNQCIDLLDRNGLLPQVDIELLKYGEKSVKSIMEEAVTGGWITEEEAEICGTLLGRTAFGGILYSHMQRQKPAPLRAIVKQIVFQRENLKLAPPLTSGSLILDTNAIDVLLKEPDNCNDKDKQIQKQLDDIIREQHITDIRITNVNVAELSAYGKLIGKQIIRNISEKESGERVERSLTIYGVPYKRSRSSKEYSSVFAELVKHAVGEGKGDADRSMMADAFLAEREKDAVVHFATGDMGIVSKIVSAEKPLGEDRTDKDEKDDNGDNRFDPLKMHLPRLWIHSLRAEMEAIEETPQKSVEKMDEVVPSKDQVTQESLAGEAKSKETQIEILKKNILKFKVGSLYTVENILSWITGDGYEIYIVGGAVRDALRGKDPKDIDMKTNMPLWSVTRLLGQYKIPFGVTTDIKLVKAGSGENMVDIVSTSMEEDTSKKPEKINREADRNERDFIMNSAIFDYQGGELVEEAGTAKQQAIDGLLQFPFDNQGNRAETIVKHLQDNPELLGRTLKFLQRSYQDPDSGKWGRKNDYHLDPEVLDIIRSNAVQILQSLTDPDKGPAATSLFIHKSGFKTPWEMMEVMNRLQFPPEAVRMIYPDSVAGVVDNGISYSREVSPRDRKVDPVDNWNPGAVPSLKIDTRTGKLYQYRIYAYAGEPGVDMEKGAGDAQKILIDIDYSDHGIPGHSSPHYHVYRIIGGSWRKNESGFSNTGQPGEPSVIIHEGRRYYTGPQPWTWWKDAGRDVEALEAKPEPKTEAEPNLEQNLEEMLGVACRKAGVSLEITSRETQKVISLGNQITLSIERVRELAESGKITKLLMLVKNLQNKVAIDPHDDSLVEMTGSGEKRERLRFAYQAEQGITFLISDCKMKKDFVDQMNIDQNGAFRLYDLANAGYAPEEVEAAGAFAKKMCDESKKDPYLFANYFEYYIATARKQVPVTKQKELLKRTEMVFSEMMGSKKASADKENHITGELTFRDAVTAAYHLHKHLDMLSVSEQDMLKDLMPPEKEEDREEREPEAGQEKEPESRHKTQSQGAVHTAAETYIRLYQDTVAQGTLVRTVHERIGKKILYFKKENDTAIVEVDLQSGEVYLLTCYRSDSEGEIQMDTRFIPEADKPVLPKTVSSKGGGANGGTVVLTDIGSCICIPVPGNGNCFFTSVELATGKSAQELRNMAADELSNNRDKYHEYIHDQQGSIDDAVKNMRRDGDWNNDYGDLVPILMSNALQKNIYILANSNGRLLHTIGEYEPEGTIVVFYNETNHYNAAVRVT